MNIVGRIARVALLLTALVPAALTALVPAALTALVPAALSAQEARPQLEGRAFLGDSVMARGTVVLHHLARGTQGELDSLELGEDGSFRFALPNLPDPALNDIFFASVRHDGVLYFGPMITREAQLDSAYEVHAYDTLLAPSEGLPVALQSRSIFFEPDSAEWRVTDLFELRNDEARTIVARPGGYVWRHPMPDGVREVEAGEGELAADAAQFLNGEIVARAALPPGGRLFVVRYRVDSPLLSLPVQPGTERLDVLVREPAPPIAIDGLDMMERQEFEEGSTYLRFAGANLPGPTVTIVETAEARPPPVQWAAVLLALVLTGAGLVALRSAPRRVAVVSPVGDDRAALLHAVAQLDVEFERGDGSEAERQAYQQRRAELIRRIRMQG